MMGEIKPWQIRVPLSEIDQQRLKILAIRADEKIGPLCKRLLETWMDEQEKAQERKEGAA